MLEIHELLDRYVILYPDNTALVDLRRAYVDNDLNSIFRLTNGNEELRKAVVEKNLHSIFRSLGDEYDELRKAVVIENLNSIFHLAGNNIDLRKAVVEKNLHSIFRSLGDEYDELRKAVVIENLNSIFHLAGNNIDLRKAVVDEDLPTLFNFLFDDKIKKALVDDNKYEMFGVLDRYCSTEFTDVFRKIYSNNIYIDKDCFSRGQIKSKIWLVNELKKIQKPLGTVYLCAGWYSTLATMIFENNFQVDKIRSFDVDEKCAEIAELFNKKWLIDGWKFKATTKDIFDINYNIHTYDTLKSNGSSDEISETPSTIINTSCEHIDNFDKWYSMIPEGKLLVLQTNNFFEVEEHVNCSESISDFSKQVPMKRTYFEGELDLGNYKRFMKIGIR
jgi:hypothetical protein